MDKETTVTTFKKLITPLVIAQGLELWGVEIISSIRPIARIFIDTQTPPSPHIFTQEQDNYQNTTQGVTIEQCAKISRLIGLILEVEAPFAAQWTLEISSPGLERPFFTLSQLEPYISQHIQITLKTIHPSWPNRKNFSGSLININLSDNTFTLNIPLNQRMPDEPETAFFSWNQIYKAKLIHSFPKPGKKDKPSKRLCGDIA